MAINLPESNKPRVVIVGAGFGGLTLARKLQGKGYQIVIIDQHNHHQFQPLLYQVAMAGLEPSSIVFPIRRIFRKNVEVYIRMADFKGVEPERKRIRTNLGIVNYDFLVLAMGVKNNFFGNPHFEKLTYRLKSVADALLLRNAVLVDFEKALSERDFDSRQELIDIVIAGAGPTGVELAGALAEMKRFVLPKEFHELNLGELDIYLVEGAPRLLPTMSEQASEAAEKFLLKMGVIIKKNTKVVDFDGKTVFLEGGEEISSKKLIWAAGIMAPKIDGLPEEVSARGGRLKVNHFLQLEGFKDIFVIGDQAFMTEEDYPNGHPQVAQPAIQGGKHLAKNFRRMLRKKELKPFSYTNLGDLATIGRNKAVADLPAMKFQGFLAWLLWLFVHLKSILGVKNKIFVLINWIWNYVTYDQSLRIIIRHKAAREKEILQEELEE